MNAQLYLYHMSGVDGLIQIQMVFNLIRFCVRFEILRPEKSTM